MSLKKAAVSAIAATMIFSGSNAVAQTTSSTDTAQSSSSAEQNGSASGDWENTSAESGSTDLQAFYNDNRDVLRPILITLAALQGIAILAGPLRTLIYNLFRV